MLFYISSWDFHSEDPERNMLKRKQTTIINKRSIRLRDMVIG
jgi:hypothetical protein